MFVTCCNKFLHRNYLLRLNQTMSLTYCRQLSTCWVYYIILRRKIAFLSKIASSAVDEGMCTHHNGVTSWSSFPTDHRRYGGSRYEHRCADRRPHTRVGFNFSVSSQAGWQSAADWLSSQTTEMSHSGHRGRGNGGCCRMLPTVDICPRGSRQSIGLWAARVEALSTWKRLILTPMMGTDSLEAEKCISLRLELPVSDNAKLNQRSYCQRTDSEPITQSREFRNWKSPQLNRQFNTTQF